MTLRMTTIFTILLAGTLSMLLFTVKHRMQDMEDEISTLNRSISSEEQAIHVLKAEWSLLNDPKRLRGLASRYLGLSPVRPEQLGSVADLSDQAGEAESSEQTNSFFQSISSALSDVKVKQ